MMKHSSEVPSPCICGSARKYSKCCEPFLSILGIQNIDEYSKSETLLIAWTDKYARPIINAYRSKVNKYIFRASLYLDSFYNYYYPLGFTIENSESQQMGEAVMSIKHNILLSIFGALSCISQGLLLQSGNLIRSCLEDSFVLIDLFLNKAQADKFQNGKYTTVGLVSRIKKYLPDYLSRWYGYFSANFTHFGPLHRAPYRPSACFADNYVIGAGTENIILAIFAVHIIIERIYFDQVDAPIFWQFDAENKKFEFNNTNRVSTFIDNLLNDLISDFPPEERKKGYKYRRNTFKTKL